MTRIVFAAVAAVAALASAPQPAKAYEAPWCAVVSTGQGSVYWDCQYRSIEECRPNVLSGNRGTCNMNPAYVGNPVVRKHAKKRRVHPQT